MQKDKLDRLLLCSVNGPQIMYIRLGYNYTVLGGPFVALFGHIGPYLVDFGVILAARARGWASLEPISHLLCYSKLLE